MIEAKISAVTVAKSPTGVTLSFTFGAEHGSTFASDLSTYTRKVVVSTKDTRAAKRSWLEVRSLCRAGDVDAPKEVCQGAKLAQIAKALIGKIVSLDFCANGEVVYEKQPPPTPPRPTLADRAGRVGYNGPRLATGFASLDGDATRGGLPFGKIVVLGAAPCGSKTMVAIAWAHGWAQAGIPVFILAADGGAEDIMIRLGQREGFDRSDLERGDAKTRKAYTQKMLEERLPLDVDDDMSVEDACKRLDQMCAERSTSRGVLMIDSTQTALCAAHDERTREPRQRVDATMLAVRQVRKRGHLTILTSEVPRTYYGGERKDPLAAFKESGSVEYAADLAIVLSPDDATDEPDVIVAEVTRKNRLGAERPTFYLKLDRQRASVTEMTLPPPRRPRGEPASKALAEARMVEDVLAAMVKLGPGVWTQSKIRGAVQDVRGKEGRADVAATRKALGVLVDRGILEPRPGETPINLPRYTLRPGCVVGPLKGGPNQPTTQPEPCAERPGETK